MIFFYIDSNQQEAVAGFVYVQGVFFLNTHFYQLTTFLLFNIFLICFFLYQAVIREFYHDVHKILYGVLKGHQT